MRHDCVECRHEKLSHCPHCKRVYCTRCGKTWYDNQPQWYPKWYTIPIEYSYGDTTNTTGSYCCDHD